MKILSIEACLGECSVALLSENNVISSIEEKQHYKQSEKLILMVEHALEKGKVNYNQLDCIAVSIGPGSFTGIRIGISAANAISFAIHKKVIGVSCLEAMAHNKTGRVCAVLDAGRNQLYAQKFIGCTPTSSIELVDYDLLSDFAANFRIVGNKFADEFIAPNAIDVGLVALKSTANGLDKVSPLYVRPPDAKITISK